MGKATSRPTGSSQQAATQNQLTPSTIRQQAFKITCYAYPCNVESGIQKEGVVETVLKYYDVGNSVPALKECEEAHLLELFGNQPKEKNILAMERDEVKQFAEQLEFIGEAAKDKTLMAKDFETLTHIFPQSNVKGTVIDTLKECQLPAIKKFLLDEDELKILCLIGHGLSSAHVQELRQYPAEYDTILSAQETLTITDQKKKKPRFWKWELTECNDLGQDYTPKSVCSKAEKGDIVAFAAGFITPEWVLKQLVEREETSSSPCTLVLLVDACYSGAWIDRIRVNVSGLKHTRVIVQTACAADQVSHHGWFIPLWCELQNISESIQSESTDPDEVDQYVQTPQFYDSDKSRGDIGLKFFKDKLLSAAVEQASTQDVCKIISGFENVTIESYKLKHIRNKTPMAIIHLLYDQNRSVLHIHFDSRHKLSGINIFNVEETEDSCIKYVEIRPPQKKVTPAEIKKHIGAEKIEVFLNKCKQHVQEHPAKVGGTQVMWDKKETWNMKTPEPPCDIHSRAEYFLSA